MKVLILSMTVGQGHNSAGNALREDLESQGHHCVILDTYKYLSKPVGLGMEKGYNLMGRYVPKLNENIYRDAERYNGSTSMRSYFPWAFADLNRSKMSKYIQECKPDVIVCTIVMTAILVTALKQSGLLEEKVTTYGIVTDFTLHPFWEHTAMDYFVIPNELMIPQLVRRGIVREKILPFGIPVRRVFAQKERKEVVRERLGLEQDKLTVLVASGGMGFAGLSTVLEEVDDTEELQIVAICGKNKQLYNKLLAMQFRNDVHVLGYVANMHEYLDACDVYVTKPGGLSTSEAIAKRIPLILMHPIPGVENFNQTFLVNHSLALLSNKYQSIGDVLSQLRINHDRLDEILNAQAKWGKPHSARELSDFISSMNQ